MKFLIIVLVVCMIATSFVACGNNSALANRQEISSSESVSSEAVSSNDEEKITAVGMTL